ncbi:MAG TPA: hypothetical protein VGI74_21555 [Streptosporangiaceae bacterium]|jgi:hypothetical protein
MWNRFVRNGVAVAGALLAFGGLGSVIAGAANADGFGVAGYHAGNGAWSFRYVTTTFSVPLLACTGDDDFVAAGVQLAGDHSTASLGVICNDGQPVAAWGTSSLNQVNGGNLIVSNDDNVTLSIYYDTNTGFDHFNVMDNTTDVSGSWAHKAGVALYRSADAAMVVPNPLQHQPAPGTNGVLVGPFTKTTVTALNGTRGTGINGPWGFRKLQAFNGAHLIAKAPVLYNGWTTFNGRTYGNS